LASDSATAPVSHFESGKVIAPFGWLKKPLWQLLLLACLPLLGWWNSGLFDLDEGFYGAVVAEMNRRGDWITPWYNGKPWFEKPILLYWLAKPTIAAFGIWIGPRLPSVLCTLALYWLLARFADKRLGGSAGAWSVLVAGGFLLHAGLGRLMMTDAPLNLTFAAAMLAFWNSLVEEDLAKKRTARLLMGVALGLGILAKGPVVILLTIPIAVVTFVLQPQRRSAFWFGWATTFLAMFLVASTWYATSYGIHGQLFVQKFLIEQNLNRFLGGDKAHTVGIGTLFAYVPIVLLGALPWSIPAFKSFPGKSSLAALRECSADDAVGLRVFLATWFLVVFLFFTVSGAKLVHYVLPCMPPLALLVADHLSRSSQAVQARWQKIGVAWIVFLAVLLNVGQVAWYGASGQAEAHSLALSIPKEKKVALYQLSRREKSRGTGGTKLMETSLPSLMMVLDRATVDTESLAEASECDVLLTRTGRISESEARSNGWKVLSQGTNFVLYERL